MTYAPTRRLALGLSTLSLVALSLGSFECAGGSSSGGTGGSAPTGTGGNGSGTGGNGSGTGGNTSGTGGSVGTGGSGTGGSVSTGAGGSVATGAGGSVSTGGVSGTGGSGTGGSVGTGGSTGSGGSAGKSGTGGAAGAGATTFFTDDFESDTTGAQPVGFDNYINYNYKTTNPQSDGSGSAVIDGTHVHGGSKAVHFSAQGGSLMVFLERPLPTGTNHLYVRAYFYLTNAIGDQPASGSDNHETLLGLTTDPTNVNTQVRFGQIKGAIGTNESASDNIAPIVADWYMGAAISASTWHCIEVEFDGTAAYNSLHAYSDGTLVHSITSGSDWANSPALAANWMIPRFNSVMFGWQSFSSMKNDVWMDDLAMSTTGRIGCN